MYLPTQNAADVHFLLNYFRTRRGKELLEIASPGGAGRNKTLGQKEFERISIAIPSLCEQLRISSALDVWDQAISAQHKLLRNSKALKQNILQSTRPQGRRADRYSGWINMSIREFASISPPRPERPLDGRVSFIPMDAVTAEGQIKSAQVRSYDEVKSGYSSFRDGDILVVKITPCFENGKGAYVRHLTNGVGFGSTEFHVIRPKDHINARLLGHILSGNRFRHMGTRAMVGSAGQKRLPSSFIESFRFGWPNEYEARKAITDTLDVADNLIDLESKDLSYLRTQRDQLAQTLVTGKRRFQSGSKGISP